MPARSWTWTAILSRSLTGPSISTARASRSLPTAARGPVGCLASAAELADAAYAEPLLIHIAALLRTAEMSATPAPGAGEGRAPRRRHCSSAGTPVRQRLVRALCERERTRWYELGAGSHLAFNPDLPLADQVVALATLTAAADPASAMSLLEALPSRAEVTRIGAEALAAWAHRLYGGPGYWNPLRPDLLAEQHLADTPQLPALAIAAARLAAGQRWEASVLTQLLAELTRGALNQPAIWAALDELLAAALSRIVDLAITTGPAELADLASLALQLAPQPALAAPLVDQMPQHSVRLAALSATLTSQQVTQDRAGALGGEPDAANRLAGSLNDLSNRLARLGRREEALAAIQEAAAIRRELAEARPDAFRPALAMSLNNLSNRLATWGGGRRRWPRSRRPPSTYRELAAARPDAFRPDLAISLNNLSVRLAGLGRPEEALAAIQEAADTYRELAAARPDAFRPDLAMALNNLSLRLAGLGRREEALAAIQEAADHLPGAGRGPPGRVPARPGRLADQPVEPAGQPGAAGGGAGRDPGGRRHLPGAGRGPPGRVPARPGHVAEQPIARPGRPGAAGGGAGRDPGGRHHPPGAGRGPPGRVPARPGYGAEQPVAAAGRPGAAGGGAGRDPGGRHHPPGAGRQVARCLPPGAGTVIASCCLA